MNLLTVCPPWAVGCRFSVGSPRPSGRYLRGVAPGAYTPVPLRHIDSLIEMVGGQATAAGYLQLATCSCLALTQAADIVEQYNVDLATGNGTA